MLILLLALPARAQSGNPWFTIMWMPAVCPAQLVLHELSHAGMAHLTGVGVKDINFFKYGSLASVEYRGLATGSNFFLVAVAPRVTDLLEMAIFSALYKNSSDPVWRGLFNAGRAAAWWDFQYNTAKIFKENTAGNDAWDTVHGLGVNDGVAKVVSASLLIGFGTVAVQAVF